MGGPLIAAWANSLTKRPKWKLESGKMISPFLLTARKLNSFIEVRSTGDRKSLTDF
jgi:hypothetical protein